MKLLGALALSLILLLAGVTWWALESSGVAVLETRAADGGAHRTRVWFAGHDDELWLEAATPERGWLEDVLRSPVVTLWLENKARRLRAIPMPGEAPRRHVRQLLREKYGLRDRWVGIFQDTSRAVAVRLVRLHSPETAGDGGT